jgi:hypothetical protein
MTNSSWTPEERAALQRTLRYAAAIFVAVALALVGAALLQGFFGG